MNWKNAQDPFGDPGGAGDLIDGAGLVAAGGEQRGGRLLDQDTALGNPALGSPALGQS